MAKPLKPELILRKVRHCLRKFTSVTALKNY